MWFAIYSSRQTGMRNNRIATSLRTFMPMIFDPTGWNPFTSRRLLPRFSHFI